MSVTNSANLGAIVGIILLPFVFYYAHTQQQHLQARCEHLGGVMVSGDCKFPTKP